MEMKWFAIMMIGIAVAVSCAGAITYSKEAEVEIACYTAQAQAIKSGVPFNEKCGEIKK